MSSSRNLEDRSEEYRITLWRFSGGSGEESKVQRITELYAEG